jgi:hypothetical protein
MKLMRNLPSFSLLIAVPVWDFLQSFSNDMVNEAVRMGADVLVFPDRPWMGENIKLPYSDPIRIALLSFPSYDDWWSSPRINKTRNHVRAALKAGVSVEAVEEISDRGTAMEVVRMYNESPIREKRYFPGYGRWNVDSVQGHFKSDDSSSTLVAKWHGQVVAVDRWKFKGQVAIVASGITSLKARRHFRGIDHLLLAKQIELLAERGVRYVVYGKLGVIPALDSFKVENGFRPVKVNYNHILFSRKAMVLAKFGLHRRPDILMSKHPWILPSLARLQKHLPPSLLVKLDLFA